MEGTKVRPTTASRVSLWVCLYMGVCVYISVFVCQFVCAIVVFRFTWVCWGCVRRWVVGEVVSVMSKAKNVTVIW